MTKKFTSDGKSTLSSKGSNESVVSLILDSARITFFF